MDRQPFPLFPQTQLPPPSHLHLPPPHSSSSFRSNTLPPLSPLVASGSTRFPPASYHPSLSSPDHLPWPSHRTSSAREDVKPAIVPNDDAKGKAIDKDMQPPREHRSYQDHALPKDSDDGMPPTSDFVKKLFKCASFSLSGFSSLIARQDAPGQHLCRCRLLGSRRRLLHHQGLCSCLNLLV